MAAILACGTLVAATDWPEWRGPSRDGRSTRRTCPRSGRRPARTSRGRCHSAAARRRSIFGNRLYINAPLGDSQHTQERLVALDVGHGQAALGAALQHLLERRAAASRGAGPRRRSIPRPATSTCSRSARSSSRLRRTASVLWDRSLPEEYGAVTTHGGRTTSPIVEGDKVILNALVLAWGDLEPPRQSLLRVRQEDRPDRLGRARRRRKHYDTNYSTPDRRRHQRHERAAHRRRHRRRVPRAAGQHGREDLESSRSASARSSTARCSATTSRTSRTAKRTWTRPRWAWSPPIDRPAAACSAPTRTSGRRAASCRSFASPVMDAERLYTVDNSAIVGAFDLKTGARLWTKSLGTLQKGSPVLPTASSMSAPRTAASTSCAVGDRRRGARRGPAGRRGQARSHHRLADRGRRPHLRRVDGSPLYAIGTTNEMRGTPAAAGACRGRRRHVAATAPVAPAQVFPYEALLAPGGKRSRSRLRLVRCEGQLHPGGARGDAQWAVDQLRAPSMPKGVFTAPAQGRSAGFVKATVGGVTRPGARARDSRRCRGRSTSRRRRRSAAGVVERRTGQGVSADGRRAQASVLVRPRDDTVGRRAKVLIGPPDWSGYTIEADVRGREHAPPARRRRPDQPALRRWCSSATGRSSSCIRGRRPTK